MDKFFRLIQFSDSAFPVGTFSFSNGLETAAHIGLVRDSTTLESYVRSVATQAAFTDGVVCLLAHRAALKEDYAEVIRLDKEIMLLKMNEEARQMLTRMGKKLAELGIRLFGEQSLFGKWLADIRAGNSPGSYPVAQAIAFALCGLDEKELYASHQYGVMNMVLSASLRCMRVTHYETQAILFRLGKDVEKNYEQAKNMTAEDMNAFVPEMDIFASLHEKGKMRMFMN